MLSDREDDGGLGLFSRSARGYEELELVGVKAHEAQS